VCARATDADLLHGGGEVFAVFGSVQGDDCFKNGGENAPGNPS
jgi:hypothetical protein